MGWGEREAGAGESASLRQLNRRAATVGLLMRNCVGLMVSLVALADPASQATPGGELLLGALALWSAYRLATRSHRWQPAVIDYLLVVTLSLGLPLLVSGAGFYRYNTAPLAVAGTGVISFAVSVGPAVSVALALGIAVSYTCGAAGVIGWEHVAGVSTLYYFGLQWATSAAIRLMVQRVAAAVDRARAARQAAELERDIDDAVRAYEQEQLSLLHDTAASTLMMVGQDSDLDAARLAGQARRDLDLLSGTTWTDTSGPVELVAALRHCAQHRLTPVRFAGRAELLLDGRTAGPLTAAVAEVLNNVDRHARAASAVITVSDRAVTVADDGVGFDPARVRRGRGVDTSITARMRAAGGAATIVSAPGAGTEVTLTWRGRPAEPPGLCGGPGFASAPPALASLAPPPPTLAEPPDAVRLIARVRRTFGLALTVYALANLAFAATAGGSGGFDAVLVGISAAATLCALPGILRDDWRLRRPALVVLATVAGIQPLLLDPAQIGDSTHWTQASIGWCVVPLVLTRSTPVAVGTVVSYWVLGGAVAFLVDPSAAVLVNLGLGTASILGVQFFALVFNGMVREAAVVADAECESHQRLVAGEELARALRAEHQRRFGRLLDNVMALLGELATGEPLTDDLRSRSRAESRRLRALFDQAATFEQPLMRELRTLVDDAEDRGVEVTVDLGGDLDELDAAEVPALVDPIREIVADARIFVRLVVTGLSGEVSVSAVCDRSAGPETFERSAGAEYVCTEDTVWVAVGRQTAAAVG